MLPDLLRARGVLSSSEHLVVFTGSVVDELEGSLLRVDAWVRACEQGRFRDLYLEVEAERS